MQSRDLKLGPPPGLISFSVESYGKYIFTVVVGSCHNKALIFPVSNSTIGCNREILVAVATKWILGCFILKYTFENSRHTVKEPTKKEKK